MRVNSNSVDGNPEADEKEDVASRDGKGKNRLHSLNQRDDSE